jgi:hypothetical protein
MSSMMLFRGVAANGNAGLRVTDGTASGTHELTSISGAPSDFTVFNGEVLFSGYDATGHSGLWMTLDSAAEAGLWKVQSLFLDDQAGNAVSGQFNRLEP